MYIIFLHVHFPLCSYSRRRNDKLLAESVFLIKNTVLGDKNNLMFINLGSSTHMSSCPSAALPEEAAKQPSHWFQGICSRRKRAPRRDNWEYHSGHEADSRGYKLTEGHRVTLTDPTTLSPPRPTHPTGRGTFYLIFVFPWRAELPSLSQSFLELCPAVSPLCPAGELSVPSSPGTQVWRGAFHGSLCHNSAEGKGRGEQPESREHVSLSISKCSEVFNSVPKQADRAVTLWQPGKLGCAKGWCYRAGMPGSQAAIWEPDYFCSQLKPKHLQSSWQSCSLKTYTLGVFLSVWGLHISFPKKKKILM